MKQGRNNRSVLALLLTLCVPIAALADSEMTFQSADFHTLADGMVTGVAKGGGTMRRSEDDVWVTFSNAELDTTTVYTVWAIVFNHPEFCANGAGACVPSVDLGTKAVKGSVFYATGFISGEDGQANFSAHIAAGEPPRGLQVLLGSGLESDNGFDAEIHFALRSHGKPERDMVAAQLSSVGGNCAALENGCVDQQGIGFNPNPVHKEK